MARPGPLAVHPGLPALFLVSLGAGLADRAGVVRLGLDGRGLTEVLAGLTTPPSSLLVDTMLDRLYWAATDSIDTAKLDGSDHRTILQVNWIVILQMNECWPAGSFPPAALPGGVGGLAVLGRHRRRRRPRLRQVHRAEPPHRLQVRQCLVQTRSVCAGSQE